MHTPGQAALQQNAHVALALHGAGAGGWEFDVWRSRFAAAGWDFHAPDLQPCEPLESTGLDDYRRQVWSWISHLQPQVLIGASLGGLLALSEAAACNPLLPSAHARLILVNPLPPAPWSTQLPQRDWPARLRWGHGHDLARTRRALGQVDTVSTGYAHARWRDESGAVLRDAHAGMVLPALPRARSALVIAGALDTDVPATVSRTLAEGLEADYLEQPESGHVDPLFGVRTQALLDDVLGWLGLKPNIGHSPASPFDFAQGPRSDGRV